MLIFAQTPVKLAQTGALKMDTAWQEFVTVFQAIMESTAQKQFVQLEHTTTQQLHPVLQSAQAATTRTYTLIPVRLVQVLARNVLVNLLFAQAVFQQLKILNTSTTAHAIAPALVAPLLMASTVPSAMLPLTASLVQ